MIIGEDGHLFDFSRKLSKVATLLKSLEKKIDKGALDADETNAYGH